MPFLINGIILVLFGFLALYSVSIYESFSMTLRSPSFAEPTNYYYFYQQIKAIIYIVIAVIIVRKFPLRILKSHKFATLALVGAFILQCLVFTKLGDSYGTIAKGWINLPGLPSVQPSEIFKLAFVLFLSSRILRKRDSMHTPQFLFSFIVVNALLFAIYLFIPDFWTILIMGVTALIMVRYAGLGVKKTLAVLAIGLFAGVFAGFSMYVINPNLKYIRDRFSYFFETDKAAKAAQSKQTWRQTEQALMAIGGGGFTGKGYGKGLQKFGYIPVAQSDFIFAAYAEEIGFVGNVFLIFLYCRIVFYFLKHLQHIRDPQSKMIGVGILSILMVQTLVHIGVNVQIIPNTGVTLPFISAGGTSLLISCIELMILYKILKSEERKTIYPIAPS